MVDQPCSQDNSLIIRAGGGSRASNEVMIFGKTLIIIMEVWVDEHERVVWGDF